MYIDDCLKGTQMILNSDVEEPLNLGSDELVTINQLVDVVEDIAGIRLKRNYDLAAPKGVNGRNSDNDRIKECLGWAPGIRLADGMEKTYRWIYDQIVATHDSQGLAGRSAFRPPNVCSLRFRGCRRNADFLRTFWNAARASRRNRPGRELNA